MIAAILAALSLGDSFETVVLATPEGARQPRIAVRDRSTLPEGSEGDVYVVYGTRDAVHLSLSRDAGKAFSAPRTIASVGSLALGMRRGPRIVVAGETIVITAIAGAKGGGSDENVLGWHSTDRGDSWIDDGRVNEVAGAAREGLHALAVGPGNEVFCAWMDLEKGAPRICGASFSGGAHPRWSETGVVFGDPEGICPCCHPSAAFDASGKLYVMWRGHDGGSRDMVVATSENLGRTFTKPTKLGTGTWKLEACPMDGGAIDLGGGQLRSVWRRESSIFRAELAGEERKLGEGEQPSIVLGQDGEYVAWLARRGGPLMLLVPRAPGPIQLDESANDPVLASGDRRRAPVFAAWESGPIDAPRIVVARLDRATAATGK